MNARVGIALLLIAMLAGCTAGAAAKGANRPPLSLPSADSFKSGTCRDAAEPILALGKFAYDRADAKQLSKEDRAGLVNHGDRLVALREGAEPQLAERMTELLMSIGFVRIKVGETYDPKFLRDMETARMKLQTACTQ